KLPSLRRLSLDDMNLSSDAYWEILGELTSLQVLQLDDIQSEITDAHIAHLTGLSSLKRLNISPDTKQPINITNIALKHISNLKSLERLTLHGAKITDEGLQHLGNLDSLKWMDLQGCKVTETGLLQLRKKIPALEWYL
ncbi:MAG: leucine-rich repeat domain-containing protein, partial [Planctomycetota bacterium]